MTTYDARDLLRAPGLLSLCRLPLAVAFPFTCRRRSPAGAVAILAAAGLTDVLDGWVARRLGQETAAGAVLDAIMDKLFVLTVAGTLVYARKLSKREALLLAARDLGELPLVVEAALRRRARPEQPAPNRAGKIATTMQLLAAGAVVLGLPYRRLLVAATAACGAVAAYSYWTREHPRGGRRSAHDLQVEVRRLQRAPEANPKR